MRTKFQRFVFAGVFLGIYLLIALNLSDYAEDPTSMDSLWVLIFGAVLSLIAGSIVSPYLPALLGYQPYRTRKSQNNNKSH